MIRTLHTPDGIIEKVLTPEEVRALADAGDFEAKIEVARKNWDTSNITRKMSDLAKIIGVEPWEASSSDSVEGKK